MYTLMYTLCNVNVIKCICICKYNVNKMIMDQLD